MSDMPLPSFQIDQAQLRELRIAKRWTAESAAMELRCQLGKAVEPANVKQAHSATVAYQRLERTGKTSLKTAQALADMFSVPMETLQGKEPIDAVKHLRTILARRLEEPAAQGLRNAYDECKRNSYVIGEASVDDVGLDGMAEDVAERIERVQLSRDPDEFEVLSELLGVVSRNRRNFRHPSSSPATSASRSIILPSLWKV
jgi:transcriptional regulator with XRE-family HTH domain